MFDFYVLNGKKLIDYKPRHEHYKRAWLKEMHQLYNSKKLDNFTISKDEVKKLIFLSMKMIGTDKRNIKDFTESEVNEAFALCSITKDFIGFLTPREFMTIFPIDKDYDGDRFGMKDYWYTMERVKEIGIDNVIGESVFEFLYDWQNWHVTEFIVASMEVLSRMNILQGGKDLFLEFLEEQGVPIVPHYVDEDNNLIDGNTGEILGKVNNKIKATKLFSV